MDTHDYTVTDLAGPKVAGRVVQPGDTVALTEPQARFELLAGTIVADPREAKDPFKVASSPLEAPATDTPQAPGGRGKPAAAAS